MFLAFNLCSVMRGISTLKPRLLNNKKTILTLMLSKRGNFECLTNPFPTNCLVLNYKVLQFSTAHTLIKVYMYMHKYIYRLYM